MSRQAFQIPWGKPVALDPAHHAEWSRAMRRDKRMGTSTRLFGTFMRDWINWGGNPKYRHLKGLTWQTQQEFARDIGASGERVVRRWMDELEQFGWISKSPRALGKANTYRLMWPQRPPTTGERVATGREGPVRPVNSDRSKRTAVSSNYIEENDDLLEWPPITAGAATEALPGDRQARPPSEREVTCDPAAMDEGCSEGFPSSLVDLPPEIWNLLEDSPQRGASWMTAWGTKLRWNGQNRQIVPPTRFVHERLCRDVQWRELRQWKVSIGEPIGDTKG